MASTSVEVDCTSPERFCVAVVEGPGRPLGGRIAAAAEVEASDVLAAIEVTDLAVAAPGAMVAALDEAVASLADVVVVLPGQGVESWTLAEVVEAAEASPAARFVTVVSVDPQGRLLGVDPSSSALRALSLDNLAVVGIDVDAWARAAAAAVVAAAVDLDTSTGEEAISPTNPTVVGLVVGSDLDPGAVAFVTGFAGRLEVEGADGEPTESVVEQHPGALDDTAADGEWDRAAIERLVDSGAVVIVADVDGLAASEVPCVVIGPRPDPAPGCAVAIVDPGIDDALAEILRRRSEGTGPAGLVVAEPTTIRVASGG